MIGLNLEVSFEHRTAQAAPFATDAVDLAIAALLRNHRKPAELPVRGGRALEKARVSIPAVRFSEKVFPNFAGFSVRAGEGDLLAQKGSLRRWGPPVSPQKVAVAVESIGRDGGMDLVRALAKFSGAEVFFLQLIEAQARGQAIVGRSFIQHRTRLGGERGWPVDDPLHNRRRLAPELLGGIVERVSSDTLDLARGDPEAAFESRSVDAYCDHVTTSYQDRHGGRERTYGRLDALTRSDGCSRCTDGRERQQCYPQLGGRRCRQVMRVRRAVMSSDTQRRMIASPDRELWPQRCRQPGPGGGRRPERGGRSGGVAGRREVRGRCAA